MTNHTIVLWAKNNNLHLRVLEKVVGRNGEDAYTVCKEDCPNPLMGRFSVRVEDVVPA